jgi:hypothetical protein
MPSSFDTHRLPLALLLASALGAAAAPRTPPAWSACPPNASTACEPTATCCPMQYSRSKYGCCHLEEAVCCDGSHTIMPTGDAIQNCCPKGYSCRQTGTYSSVCDPPNATTTTAPPVLLPALEVCTPGPRWPPNDPTNNPSSLPSCIVLGDSVSIGYTPDVIASLNASGTCYVQHSPWAGGGGAASTKNGLNCIQEFLRNSFSLSPVTWDLVLFNFGLHNLANDTVSENEYVSELTNITAAILASGAKHVLYALTTPMMANYNIGNHAVEDHNRQAKVIMGKSGIEIVDLYGVITGHCGDVYEDCDICAVSPCTYHYKPEGYAMLARNVSAAIEAALTKGKEGSEGRMYGAIERRVENMRRRGDGI